MDYEQDFSGVKKNGVEPSRALSFVPIDHVRSTKFRCTLLFPLLAPFTYSPPLLCPRAVTQLEVACLENLAQHEHPPHPARLLRSYCCSVLAALQPRKTTTGPTRWCAPLPYAFASERPSHASAPPSPPPLSLPSLRLRVLFS